MTYLLAFLLGVLVGVVLGIISNETYNSLYGVRRKQQLREKVLADNLKNLSPEKKAEILNDL